MARIINNKRLVDVNKQKVAAGSQRGKVNRHWKWQSIHFNQSGRQVASQWMACPMEAPSQAALTRFDGNTNGEPRQAQHKQNSALCHTPRPMQRHFGRRQIALSPGRFWPVIAQKEGKMEQIWLQRCRCCASCWLNYQINKRANANVDNGRAKGQTTSWQVAIEWESVTDWAPGLTANSIRCWTRTQAAFVCLSSHSIHMQ